MGDKELYELAKRLGRVTPGTPPTWLGVLREVHAAGCTAGDLEELVTQVERGKMSHSVIRFIPHVIGGRHG